MTFSKIITCEAPSTGFGEAPCTGCGPSGSAVCHAAGLTETLWRDGRIRLRRYRANEVLFVEGDHPGFIGILRSGYLRMQRMSPEGRRHVLNFVLPGDLVGEIADRRARFSVEASTDAEVCLFDRRAVEEEMLRNPVFRRRLLTMMSEKLDSLRIFTWLFGALSTKERVIAFFSTAIEFMPVEPLPDGSVILTLAVPRADCADLLGMALETISRVTHEMQKDGLIEIIDSRRFRIPHVNRLADSVGLKVRPQSRSGIFSAANLAGLKLASDSVAERLPNATSAAFPRGGADIAIGPARTGRAAPRPFDKDVSLR